ncbi:unnamed protein product, partial [Polarella glacialis]
YDKNRNGKLSFAELYPVLKASEPSLTDQKVRAMFNGLDKNNDDSLDFDEFVDYVCSKTAPMKGKVIHGVPWSTAVPVPRAYQTRSSHIAETEQRGMTLQQLAALAELIQAVLQKVAITSKFTRERVTWDTVNMYDIDPHFVQPLTLPFRSSFVELVAKGPQIPHWFVSHWWGTEFCQTVALLNFHLKQRLMPSPLFYWICTFANNQHDLSELTGSLLETPFVKVIMANEAVGTVTVFDAKVTTLRRIWCVLENYVSTVTAVEAKSGKHVYDIVAWLPEGQGKYAGKPVPAKPTLRMDLGNGMMREHVLDDETGGAFPLSVSVEGIKLDIHKAEATRREDWTHILHLIAETPASEWTKDPPETCEAYDRINLKARGMFAAGAIYAATTNDDMERLEQLLAEFPDRKDECIGSDCASPLHAAAFKNRLQALQVLLEARANPDVLKDGGASPIFIAAQYAHDDALKLLLQARGDVNLSRQDGFGPVHIAVQTESISTLQVLLQASANPDQQSLKGGTPLLIATQKGDLEAVK